MPDWQDYIYKGTITVTFGSLLLIINASQLPPSFALIMWLVNLAMVVEDYVLARRYPHERGKWLSIITGIYLAFLISISIVTVLIRKALLPLVFYPINLNLIAVLDIVWCIVYLGRSDRPKEAKSLFLIEFIGGRDVPAFLLTGVMIAAVASGCLNDPLQCAIGAAVVYVIEFTVSKAIMWFARRQKIFDGT